MKLALMTVVMLISIPLTATASDNGQQIQSAMPEDVSGKYEAIEGRVLNVFSAEDEGAKFRAYLVKWKDQEVIVSDPLGTTNKKVGDSINFIASNFEAPNLFSKADNPSKIKILQFTSFEYPPLNAAISSAPKTEDEKKWESLMAKASIITSNEEKNAETVKVARDALDFAEKTFGADTLYTARSSNLLADDLIWTGEYDEAKKYYKQAKAIYEKKTGPDSIEVADCLTGIGNAYHHQYRINDAEPYYLKAKAIYDTKELNAENSRMALLAYERLVYILEDRRKLAEAEEAYKKVIALYEKIYGEDRIADTCNRMTIIYMDEGKYAEAEAYCKKCIEIRKKSHGEESSWVADRLRDLAKIYAKEGKRKEEEETLKLALNIYEKKEASELKKIIPYSIAVANESVDLGRFYCVTGNYPESESYFKKAVAIYEKYVPNYNSNLSICLDDMAILYKRMGNVSESNKCDERSKEIKSTLSRKGVSF